MSETILDQIARSVQKKLEERRLNVPQMELEKRLLTARVPHAFASAFKESGTHLISEVKFRSPAVGALEASSVDRAVNIARSYIQNGARAISVLTEEDYFHGSPVYLQEIRRALPDSRLLMKDFVLDEYQILEARIHGADAVLLILSLLGPERARELMEFACAIGLETLVEVHDDLEFEQALEIGAPLIGVNNRNLKTMEVTLETSVRLGRQKVKRALDDLVLISESGIKTGDEISRLKKFGFNGFLVGSSLMSRGDPGTALKGLIESAEGSGVTG